jgi:alkylation response protein AidB-like acyl-CoA dehydrogenase
MRRDLYEAEHDLFRETAAAFMATEVVPHRDRWEAEGKVDRSMFRKAGQQGLLGMSVPERFGGGGVDDFRFNTVIIEEVMRADVMGAGMCITLHNDVAMPYFLHVTNDEQKERWLPGLASGDSMAAIAMTEPGAGSDLAGIGTTAVRDGDHYLVNGSKTFITNGINSDVVITAVKTDPSQRHAGMSLLVIEVVSRAGGIWRRSVSTPRTRPSCSSRTCGSRSPIGWARRVRASISSSGTSPRSVSHWRSARSHMRSRLSTGRWRTSESGGRSGRPSDRTRQSNTAWPNFAPSST